MRHKSMKQLNFLQPDASEQVITSGIWHLYVDGAARNNPGPAGAGLCLFKDGKAIVKKGFFLGSKTNNQAEYYALLLGLFFAREHVTQKDQLEIFADSQLLVRQINGEYKVKDAELKLLQHAAFKLLVSFNYTIQHVMREDNAHADDMANVGIDKKVKAPDSFITLIQSYGIKL